MYQYNLYRAKKDKTGLAAQFQVNNEGILYLKFARQQPIQGDEDRFFWAKAGEKPDIKKNLNIKYALNDIGNILSVLKGAQNELKIYHEYAPKGAEKVVTQMTISRYVKDGAFRGVSFSINRGGEKYGILLSYGDIEVLSVLLQDAVLSNCLVKLNKE